MTVEPHYLVNTTGNPQPTENSDVSNQEEGEALLQAVPDMAQKNTGGAGRFSGFPPPFGIRNMRFTTYSPGRLPMRLTSTKSCRPGDLLLDTIPDHATAGQLHGVPFSLVLVTGWLVVI